MLKSLLPLVVIALSIGVAAWLVFMWAVKSGQFDDIEGPKHRMLDDDDEEEAHRRGPETKKGEADE